MREYHFMITLRWTNHSGHTITASYSDTIRVAGGAKRYQTYVQNLEKAKRALDAPDPCAVVFYSLEPNELAA